MVRGHLFLYLFFIHLYYIIFRGLREGENHGAWGCEGPVGGGEARVRGSHWAGVYAEGAEGKDPGGPKRKGVACTSFSKFV